MSNQTLPIGWRMQPLGECGHWVSGGTPSKSDSSYWNGDIPWFSAKSLKTFDLDSSEDRVTIAGSQNGTVTVPEGTILFVVRGMSLANEFRVGITSRQSTLNQDLRGLIPSSDVHARYVGRYLKHTSVVMSKIDNASHGTKRIQTDKLKDTEIPLPPLPEQKRIADILDKADAIRRKRQEACDLTRAMSASLFHEMFTSRAGRLGGKNIECVNSEKGQNLITDGWRHTTLGAEITLQRGIDITGKEHRKGSVPIVSSGGISGFHDTSHSDGPGVILGRKGSVGSVHFVDGPYWPHDTTLWVREFNANQPRFVYEFFRHFPIREYEASSANPSLNRNNLHPVCVWWPPIRLQQEFTKVAAHVEKSTVSRVSSAVKESEQLFNSLVQRAFRGEL